MRTHHDLFPSSFVNSQADLVNCALQPLRLIDLPANALECVLSWLCDDQPTRRRHPAVVAGGGGGGEDDDAGAELESDHGHGGTVGDSLGGRDPREIDAASWPVPYLGVEGGGGGGDCCERGLVGLRGAGEGLSAVVRLGCACSALLAVVMDEAPWLAICAHRWRHRDPHALLAELRLTSFKVWQRPPLESALCASARPLPRGARWRHLDLGPHTGGKAL